MSTRQTAGRRLVGFGLAVGIALVALAGPVHASDAFSDVPDDHPFHDEIRWLAESGITTGFPDGTFRPGVDVTRQAIAAYLYRYSGLPLFTPPASPTFTDVPATHPFYKEIEWLAQSGITTGFDDGTFRPGVDVTRQAVAAYFYRLAGEPAFTPPGTPTFTDVPATHPFFADIEWLNDSGVTTGFDDGTFRPGVDVTRQAIAAYFYRYDDALSICGAQTSIPRSECDALVAIYNETNGPEWTNASNWLVAPDPCTWEGIFCSAGTPRHVIEVALTARNLSGPFPAAFGDLTHLQRLRAGTNALTGPIPAEVFELVHLEEAYLTTNLLDGPIAAEWADMPNLRYLALNSNEYTGPVPAELATSTTLDYLDLDNNDLTGSIPPELLNMPGLVTLDLSRNELSGPIPTASSSPDLHALYLNHNHLTGTIPTQLADLTNLSNLDLGGNQLTGTIPTELGGLTGVGYLNLSDNQLTGTIPIELGNLTGLSSLHLSNNQLTGTIPTELGSSDLLTALHLADNDLSGPVPVSLLETNLEDFLAEGSFSGNGCLTSASADLTLLLDGLDPLWTDGCHAICTTQSQIPTAECVALTTLYATTGGPGWNNSDGWLTDPQPCTWFRVTCAEGDPPTHVTRIELYANSLTGALPDDLTDLTDLERLNLGNNQLTGTIPTQLTDLTNLNRLNLASNQLTGNIPTQLADLTNLTNLDLGGNQLTGTIPTQPGKLSLLDLSGNQLTGTIPTQLGNLNSLSILNLGNNQLTGTIPTQPGNLNVLDLSENQLTGTIPTELGNLAQLSTLYLHANDLSGPVPTSLLSLPLNSGTFSGNGCLTSGSADLTVRLDSLDPSWTDGCRAVCTTQSQIPTAECVALTSLYASTGGPSWDDNTGWLTDLSPCTWYGVTCATGDPPTHVTGLDLDFNALAGAIPGELGDLTALTTLHLRSGELGGPIPPELGSLAELTSLRLSDNQLTGTIPIELGNLTKLDVLDLAGNQLTGTIPTTFNNLEILLVLYLNDNQLTGTIPTQLGGLTGIGYLNLSHNQLTGAIPTELGNLVGLDQLNLSGNQLTGSIPASFGNLTAMTELYLGGNLLSGAVPTSLLDLDMTLLVATFGPNGCLTSSTVALTNFLNSFDPTWDDACP